MKTPERTWIINRVSLIVHFADREGNNFDPEDNFGYRGMDLDVDRSDRVGQYPDLDKDWWVSQKASHPVVHSTGDIQPLSSRDQAEALLPRHD
jgi:hypothetical protein